MNYAQRINEALANADENIAFLARFADAKLERKLNIVQAQIALAMQNKQLDALQLLYIWERQIIEARIQKYDQHPPLDELTELEQRITEMEAFDAEFEKRQKLIAQKPVHKAPVEQANAEPEDKPGNEATQMKLF